MLIEFKPHTSTAFSAANIDPNNKYVKMNNIGKLTTDESRGREALQEALNKVCPIDSCS